MNRPVKPLKRFGQNFLVDRNVLDKIFAAFELGANDTVLEIGPGDGAMTFRLAKIVKQVVAVEIDRGRCQALKERDADIGAIEIIEGDFLKFDLVAYARRRGIRSFVVVANIPYYITTPILEKLFGSLTLIKDIYLTVQKEVADRFIAHPDTPAYGSLTCFVRYFTSPAVLFKIKPGSFYPSPKVDSCFVRLKPHGPHGPAPRPKSEELFFKIMRSAFGQRRKTLAASLSRAVGKPLLIEASRNSAKTARLLQLRPQELSLDDFLGFSNQIFDISRRG